MGKVRGLGVAWLLVAAHLVLPAAAEQAPAGPAGPAQAAPDGQATAARSGEIADMAFQGADVADVFRVLGELAGVNVLVDPSASGTVTFFLRRISPMEAIDLVARSAGLAYRIVQGTLVVSTPQLLKERFADEKVATAELRHLDPAEAERLVRAVVPEVQVASLARSRTVWIRGPAAAVQRARELLLRQDVAVTPELEFSNAPLTEVLKSLARAGGFSLVLTADLKDLSVTLYLRPGMPVSEALEAVARQAGVQYRFDSPTLVVVSAAPATPQARGGQPPGSAAEGVAEAASAKLVRGYELRYLSVGAARQIVASALPDLEVSAVEERRALLMRGTASRLDEAVALLRSYDRPALRAAGVIQVGSQFRALLDVNGSVHLVRAGSKIGELEVVAIDLEGVTVRLDGETTRVPAGGGAT